MSSRLHLFCLCILALATSAPLRAQTPIGELSSAPGASVRGALKLGGSGTEILSGSLLKAGDQPAELRLSRGGELRVCSLSSLAVSAPAPDSALLIGLNTGSLEIECAPKAYTDVVLTPDLRLQLTGPGRFHFAVGVRANGDTCVRMLSGDESSLIVGENAGEGAYQVHPGQSLLFREGRLAGVVEDSGVCGCPEAVEASRTTSDASGQVSEEDGSHLDLDAPLAFIGGAEQQSMILVARLQVSREPVAGLQPTRVYQPKKRGLLNFLRRLFHRAD